ncbi:PilC/PilY family type IV pilus protein [Marinobacter sp. BGYM27]|uniref:pilus assembly protein n=1 Tax=unclassified Marinobacter TaxID=83889 RepID=UPI0021A7ADFB|nr:PilC/PilY family type IV pilus protein [Marinobacter sp. BGYM27]MDG5500675.1 PilC/PilY family type IV pilus protein [Marinobacter sp. BGYM27]
MGILFTRRGFVYSCLTTLLLLPAAGYSARPDFAQKPLFIGSSVSPNLMFMLDDSGSMAREYMPDDIGNHHWTQTNELWYYSNEVNKVYYNPDVDYLPPYKKDGTGRYPNSSFTDAPRDGYSSNSPKEDLTLSYRTPLVNFTNPAFYTQFNSTPVCDSNPKNDACYTVVFLTLGSDEEKQNFANWYSFYNTRIKAARAGISEAFYDLPPNFRLGWGRINYDGGSTNNIDGASGVRGVQEGVREYTSARREDFLDWLYDAPASGGTPLRRALEGAGKYYEGSARAWSDNPGTNVSSTNPTRECRLSYTILMSDGYYGGSNPSGNVYKADDNSGPNINGPDGKTYQYVAKDPFKDNRNSYTLADVAMYYWNRDLQTGIDNYVPTSDKNPAFWQHMVSYTVGLGVSGTVDPVSAFNAIASESAINWWGGSNNEDKINDMLHAAVNGRGGFFSASDSNTFATELKKTVDLIVAEAGSSTAVEFDVSSFQQGGLIFSAQFDPNGWTGDIKAAKLGGTDSPVVPNFDDAIAAGDGWSAKQLLDSRDLTTSPRTILTMANNVGTTFQWANLSTPAKNDLKYGGATNAVAQQRLGFIRGDRSLEDGVNFRKRTSRLGSIVNSSPEFVGAPRAVWPDAAPFGTDSKRFSDFVTAKKSRTPVVYSGSNDGMVHGFNALDSGGNEVLAYIPEFVYSTDQNAGLHFLADPDYQHRFYVDLEMRQQDIFTKGKQANGALTLDPDWRTIIVGGGRAGAKGIFALDVTSPANFSDANAQSIALWEFSEADDSRLGYVTQAPIISKARWGTTDVRWTAFLSNGYNADTASSGFFMLDIEGGMDGSWDAGDVRYIEFETGGDGLSPLTALDTTGDYITDRIYAGDLDGNVWVASVDAAGAWGATYKTGSTPVPLFSAASGQAITAAPVVAANKEMPRAGNEPNLLVYFGTGQYFETADVTDTSTQSVYGIWDRGGAGIVLANLVQRTLTEGTLTVEGVTNNVRYSNGDAIDFSSVKGWYANFPTAGERAVVSPQLRGDYVYLNSIIPDQNPCTGGGSGWIMAFGLDGKTPTDKAFLDFSTSVSGYQTDGLTNQSTILGNYRFTSGGGGGGGAGTVDIKEIPPMSGAAPGAGRRGWHELVE